MKTILEKMMSSIKTGTTTKTIDSRQPMIVGLHIEIAPVDMIILVTEKSTHPDQVVLSQMKILTSKIISKTIRILEIKRMVCLKVITILMRWEEVKMVITDLLHLLKIGKEVSQSLSTN